MALTKTNFMRGMQCPKMLWLDKHKPELKIIPPEVQARLDAGNEFGDRAMSMFGDYEEMTVYRPGTTSPDKRAMLRNTEDALNRGVPVICEAAFSNYNNYCAVDILRRTDTGYDIYEVKNSLEVSEQFIKDVAFQHYIVSRCGLKIGKIFIVLSSGDEDDPFLPGIAVVRNLGSPKAMDRMLSYLQNVKPKKAELIVDEMLGIMSEIDAWRDKKESQKANAAYNEFLYRTEQLRTTK